MYLDPHVYLEAAAAVEGQEFWVDRIRTMLQDDQGSIPIVGCTLETRVKAHYDELIGDTDRIRAQIEETVAWLRQMAAQAENDVGVWAEHDVAVLGVPTVAEFHEVSAIEQTGTFKFKEPS